MKFTITALKIISLSEIAKIKPQVKHYNYADNEVELRLDLHNLGMQVDHPYEMQDVQHRNTFNEIVTCPRWVGLERVDEQWVNSSYASEEAIDKAKNNNLLNDLYRLKGKVEL